MEIYVFSNEHTKVEEQKLTTIKLDGRAYYEGI